MQPSAPTAKLCVNVLSAEQQTLAAHFATSTLSMAERFAAAQWDALATGAPVLRGALASLDCEIESVTEVGTHTVFFCAVKAAHTHVDGDALIYYGRRYHRVGARSVQRRMPPKPARSPLNRPANAGRTARHTHERGVGKSASIQPRDGRQDAFARDSAALPGGRDERVVFLVGGRGDRQAGRESVPPCRRPYSRARCRPASWPAPSRAPCSRWPTVSIHGDSSWPAR